ncbi:modulator of macroautophagy TMEM150B isoform X1 [Oryzias melastigma]|uniref:Transmembrane protein 150B n=1 Tax=Oryzias melastigma TaxID=30732 RepID=A0A3B3E124_ORYME|nr:modulator of macroautophagy TMEM150B isoform X1 [Oryzias melastigma]
MWLLALVPLCLAVFGSLGIWTVFAVSVMNNSVNLTHGFPYISDCARVPPQKCLFSQICNLIVLSALWIGMVQFQQVKQLGNHGRVNTASAILGFLFCGGLSISTSFHEPETEEIHAGGSIVAFLLAMIYFWLQVYLTYEGRSFPERVWMWPLRALICTIGSLIGLAIIGFFVIDYISGLTVCEFALAMVIFILFGLFAVEFRHIECHVLIVQKTLLKDEKNLESVKANFTVVEAIS